MGASWGGFESLILPVHPERLRTRRALGQRAGAAPPCRARGPGRSDRRSRRAASRGWARRLCGHDRDRRREAARRSSSSMPLFDRRYRRHHRALWPLRAPARPASSMPLPGCCGRIAAASSSATRCCSTATPASTCRPSGAASAMSSRKARLFPALFGARQSAVRPAAATSDAIAFDAVVALLGIENLLDRRPGALSGGEKQRVAHRPRAPGGAAPAADGRAAGLARRSRARREITALHRAAARRAAHSHRLCHATPWTRSCASPICWC